MHEIDPVALPFEFKGYGKNQSIGCLLIHSFTTSPSEVRPLGAYLRNKGYSGIAPLLPGHGSHPEDLRHTTWLDWYADARAGFVYLRENYDRCIIIGVGLGSILAVMLAASPERENIHGLILITPSHHAPSAMVKTILPFIKYFKKDFQTVSDLGSLDSLDEDGQFFYTKRPTEALIELYRIIGFTNQRLSLISQPTLIIHHKDDYTSSDFIFDKLVNAPLKERYTHEKGARWFFYTEEAEEAFAKIDEFVQMNCLDDLPQTEGK
ncbi:MAG: alpha/beta hydrolase [Candidatus Heimdallarchaeota archaeon]